jgi:hypothetical protein
LLAKFSDLVGVIGAAADSVRKDRGVGCDPDDVAVFNQPVQRAGCEQSAA